MFNTTKNIDGTCQKQPRSTVLLTVGDNFMPLSWQTPISKYLMCYAICVRVHGGNKFALIHLIRKKTQHINASLIEELYMIYECRVIDIINNGEHDVFIVDVILIHNKRVIEVNPTLFLGEGYYE